MEQSGWRGQFHGDLEYVLAGTPEEYIPRLLQRQDLTQDQIFPYLFCAYEVGRENKDTSMTEKSKKVLQTQIPDLERRLPYYEIMFNIMDKGTFMSESGFSKYDLKDQLFQQLSQQLSQRVGISEQDAGWCVQRFSKDLAFVPGAQFNVQLDSSSLQREERIALITMYLHQPMRKVMTVREERSPAALHYKTRVIDMATPPC